MYHISLNSIYILLVFFFPVATPAEGKRVGMPLFFKKVWEKVWGRRLRGENMREKIGKLLPILLVLLFLPGCSAIGDKADNMSMIYGVAALLSLLLLVGYCSFVKKKDIWYLLLFASILVVNIGYFALAISRSLGEALLANRLSYLGSVFLPLSMWMIIINATHISYRKWLPGLLLSLAVVMFLIAASPGYLTIYYKSVTFQIVKGVATLQKEYGPLHSLYLVYLLGYFGAMVATIVYATARDKIDSLAYAVIIAIAVFVNLGVWMIEQLVSIEFEILSISYIISECFLLGLHILMAEAEKLKAKVLAQGSEETVREPAAEAKPETVSAEDSEQVELFLAGLSSLTPKEQALYRCYVGGMTTDVIMEKLDIKENTLKFHSKNLYGKLGVKSRKQLMEIYKKLPAAAREK